MTLIKASQFTGKTSRSERKVTAVIPCLNDGKTLKQILPRVKRYVDEIVVVDDGSTDDTNCIVKSSGDILLKHKQILGYDRSLKDGFELAVKRGAKIIVTVDADGEIETRDVKRALGPVLDKKASIVIGDRTVKRHLAERVFSRYTKFLYGLSDPLSGLKVYDVNVYRSVGFFSKYDSIGSQLTIETAKRGKRIVEIPIKIKSRADKSRFYNKSFKSNLKVLRALLYTLVNVY